MTATQAPQQAAPAPVGVSLIGKLIEPRSVYFTETALSYFAGFSSMPPGEATLAALGLSMLKSGLRNKYIRIGSSIAVGVLGGYYVKEGLDLWATSGLESSTRMLFGAAAAYDIYRAWRHRD